MHWNAVIFGPEDTPWDGGTMQYESLVLGRCPASMPYTAGFVNSIRSGMRGWRSHLSYVTMCRHIQAEAGVHRGVP